MPNLGLPLSSFKLENGRMSEVGAHFLNWIERQGKQVYLSSVIANARPLRVDRELGFTKLFVQVSRTFILHNVLDSKRDLLAQDWVVLRQREAWLLRPLWLTVYLHFSYIRSLIVLRENRHVHKLCLLFLRFVFHYPNRILPNIPLQPVELVRVIVWLALSQELCILVYNVSNLWNISLWIAEHKRHLVLQSNFSECREALLPGPQWKLLLFFSVNHQQLFEKLWDSHNLILVVWRSENRVVGLFFLAELNRCLPNLTENFPNR